MARRSYPVGKAQAQVLEALDLTAEDHADAKRQFEELGIVVSSRRQGRKSVPVVTVKSRYGGGFNPGGDGESWREYLDVDFTAISEWIEED